MIPDRRSISDSQKAKGEGHRERLRDKFLLSGLLGFHDYEVIELLLTLATPRKDCKSTAKAALARFKTFQGVLEASIEELCEIPGIGPRNALGVRLIKAVADRYLEKTIIRKDQISHSKALFEYLYHTMRDKERESFKALFLDSKNQILAVETLFEGTLNASSVYPREVVARALTHRAAALIFAHNHPSGDPAPSREDVAVTRRLVFACRVVGARVHDHLIVGDNRYFSFADEGYIAKMNNDYEAFEAEEKR
ncbi:MAG: DNA repair protein RadC [Thermodesulfobacteriota bacterium]